MPWSLSNAEALAAASPRSFFIPPAGRRHALRVGDTVKLVFELERADGEATVERMWVDVVDTDPYVGTLANTPTLAGVIDPEARVEFAAEHVCGFAYDPGELGYDTEASCFLLRRVANAAEPPARLFVSDDGVWEAHADNETGEEINDSANVVVWPLGYLTDAWPALASPLREGSATSERGIWWRFDGVGYVRQPG